ncbi:uncharacterized protein CMU_029920 [Cryptosporidium muris RN66]|uniref:Condensation domain-containing protein n=1 Tax=Cryptosporidium muris (strain RN66) TaxID=441375 RepID=B6AI75_CRYMR|nr:uncharacterized protein CMU_029920 [Cryptosporidium muris RN66]EEA07916.1 hypothetical protein, conserved [Cryptosporidium muris RN66]|eukprot:XP_002142265.1 hypothetical protein [Cryptosporidium muris RN66]
MTQCIPIRALDVVETFWETFYELGNVIIMNPIIIRSSFPIKKEILKEAATKMAYRHQSLRVRIKSKVENDEGRDTIKRYFVDLVDDFEVVIEEDPETTATTELYLDSLDEKPIWENLLLKEQNELFSKQSPLWRIRFKRLGSVNNQYRACLVASFHHAIMDGLSRQHFWTELLGLCTLINEFPDTPIPQEKPTKMPNSVCKSFPSSLKVRILKPFYSWRATATQGVCLYRNLVAPFENPSCLEISRDLYADKEKSPRTCILPIKISSEVFSKLRSICKSKKMQVNGAIEAVAALGLMALIYELRSKKTLISEDTTEILVSQDERNLIGGSDRENITCVTGCRPIELSSTDCFLNTEGCSAVIPIRTMVAINCRRWVNKDDTSEVSETSKSIEDMLIRIFESALNNSINETTTATASEKNFDSGTRYSDTHESTTSQSSSLDENSSSFENCEVSEKVSNSEIIIPNKQQKEHIANSPRLVLPKLKHSFSFDKSSPSWLKKAVSKVISPRNSRKIKCMPSVALGSYAVLMGLDMKVQKSCLNDVNKIWELGKNTTRKIHSIVDSKDPSTVTFKWHVISGFVHDLANSPTRANKVELLMQLGNPTARPSSFLVSNGGIWDSKPLEQLIERINNSKSGEKTFIEVESSYSCVSQHNAGLNMFAHNLVTVNGDLCWSLQYHTNITKREVAQIYAKYIQKYIHLLVNS